MKILYIHGLSSSGQSSTVAALRRLLPHDTIIAPDLPIDPKEALYVLLQTIKHEHINLIIGSSMGGMLAQKFRGIRKILVNPSFHVSHSMRQKLGTNTFLNPRKDGATEYEITEELCNLYEEIESQQFYNIPDNDIECTIGLFGTYDDTVNCSDEFLQHYTHHYTFNGGHRLDEASIRNSLIPLIASMQHTRVLTITDAEAVQFCVEEWLCLPSNTISLDMHDFHSLATGAQSLIAVQVDGDRFDLQLLTTLSNAIENTPIADQANAMVLYQCQRDDAVFEWMKTDEYATINKKLQSTFQNITWGNCYKDASSNYDASVLVVIAQY